ncbi:MAG TPA: hypothetical protein VJR89_27490 [Polyangiales bacterium]|nr:hypothetical protein [Polyangiales bacterium]
MRNAIAALFACLTIAGSAHAQENFELDDYRRSFDRYTSAVDPWFDAAGDPDCVYIPARFNMAAGDVVLSTDRDGIIYKLLSSLGYQHSHSGMATSEAALRHNTASEDEIDTIDSNLVPQRLRGTGDHSVRDAWPGMIEQTVEAATSTREFLVPDGLVLYSWEDNDSWDTIASHAEQRERVLDQMARLQGYYSFYAYTDVTWDNPYTRAFGSGNVCSGSIYHAHRLAENFGWGPEVVRYFPNRVRQPAADLLYNELRRTIRAKPDWFGEILFAISGLFSTSLDDFADRASNQVVNCMAFDDCSNTRGRWRQGVGDGASLAPDDLVTIAFLYAFGSGGVDSEFLYNAVRPLEETGSYYCCTGWDSGDFFLDGYKTLTCSGG